MTRFSVTCCTCPILPAERHPGTEPGDAAEGAALAGKHEGIHGQLASGVAWFLAASLVKKSGFCATEEHIFIAQ